MPREDSRGVAPSRRPALTAAGVEIDPALHFDRFATIIVCLVDLAAKSPTVRYPMSSFPTGWYCVALGRDVPRGAVHTARLAGRDVVLFRTEGGHLAAVDAYCPHLGAHLGKGGTVDGERLRCPFHGFCFDREGRCVETPYEGKPPPRATLGSSPVRELGDFVLVWHHVDRDRTSPPPTPTFEVPAYDTDGWTPLSHASWPLQAHVQETNENSVDLGHFTVVHGYRDVTTIEEASLDGPRLTARYGFTRAVPGPLGRLGVSMRTSFRATLWGLGYSFVEARVDALGLDLRHWVLATPEEVGVSRLRIAMSMRVGSASRWPAVGTLLPHLLGRVAQPTAMRGYEHDVQQDFEIWQNKAYLEHPALAQGDGPIGRFRRWCRQFYAPADGA